MHRLLNIQGKSFYKYSRESFSLLNANANDCLLCKLNNTFTDNVLFSTTTGSVRFNSTIVNPSLKKYKKFRKKKKEYAELLFVTENSSCQRRATVKKLTFSDLELLATTNLNLSELYKLKELSQNKIFNEHTYNNLNMIDNFPTSSLDIHKSLNLNVSSDNNKRAVNLDVPDMNIVAELQNVKENMGLPITEIFNDSGELSSIHVEQEAELESLKVINTFQPEVLDDQISEVEEIKDPPGHKAVKTDTDRKRREEIITKTVAAYIEVCAHLKNPQRGLSALNFHRIKTKRLNNKTYIPIKSPNVYNALLKGFAQKGSFSKIKEILDIMKEEEVECTVQSYVAIFECLALIEDNLKELENYANKALAQNITFDKIMNEGIFLNNERDLVLNVMRKIDSNYAPKYNNPIVFYDNQLVNHLNHPEQENPFVPNSKESNGLFTPFTLKELVDKQISLEKEGHIT
ncbi:unnamed protein product [Psylliodes chrysocephalus]|uniref:Uncharacterized protein n=1 Tax=Psylliodes chrysocephalus TaxID=3402493 RepID=A0A9P0G6U7_9CUCU|nr:unnamed protein product [Psylliodes chrysocephala]